MDTLKAFSKFIDEGLIVGRLLAAYSDLELTLLQCVHATCENFDTVYKVMFKERGETRRINMADILGRHKYRELALGTQFEMALSSTRFCLKIRNQYAHCVWYDDYSGHLAFTDLERGTATNDIVNDFKDLTIRHIDHATLAQQEQYFEYTDSFLKWLNIEGRRLAGKPSYPQGNAPQQMNRPPLYLS
ncbi:MAG: hypothetical protein U5R49_12075 [Deltaproteobacteria bacterium]|nr:hypothetical protein [Deltaproteobacteria bacterium]